MRIYDNKSKKRTLNQIIVASRVKIIKQVHVSRGKPVSVMKNKYQMIKHMKNMKTMDNKCIREDSKI
jgi:hypothetical protein